MPHRARPQILATFDDRPLCLIESGKQPAKWELFPNRDENLSFLYYTLGLITQETSPTDAAAAFTKAAQSNGNYKKDPSTYTLLANIYEINELKKLVDAYTVAFPSGVAIPDEKKPQYQQMLDQIFRGDSFPSDACARLLHHTDVRGFLFSCGTQGVEEVLRCHCPSQFAGHHVMDGGRISGRSLRIHQDGLDRLVPTPDIEVVSVDRYDHTAGQFVCGLRLGWNSSATRFPTRRSR